MQGSIFRLLIKPCDRDVMVKTLTSALMQYRLVSAEKEPPHVTFPWHVLGHRSKIRLPPRDSNPDLLNFCQLTGGI